MARKEFAQFEAVSAVVPVEPGVYHAAIAVKALYEGGAPRFTKFSPSTPSRLRPPPMPPRPSNLKPCKASLMTPNWFGNQRGRCILNSASGPSWK